MTIILTVLLIIGIIILAIWLYNQSSAPENIKNSVPTNISVKQSTRIKGRIGYFGLEDWWLSTFNENEREYIVKTFSPLTYGSSEDTLISGNITDTSDTVVNMLSSLSGWFKKEPDRTIGYRLIKKAEDLITAKTNILDLHFLYQHKIEIYYRYRAKDSFALEETINACKKQIEISGQAKLAFKKEYKGEPLPSHTGFEILTKLERDREVVIEIAKRALKEGWDGDWKEIIKDCKEDLKGK